MTRPTWDETWMAVADTVSLRSKCVRRQAGCVLVTSRNAIVSVGYNGPPRYWRTGTGEEPDGPCDGWCERARTGGSMSYDDCPSVHSEANALMHADLRALTAGTAYVTSGPCLTCAKNLANSGIHRVVYRIAEVDLARHPELTTAYFHACGIEVHHL